MCLNIYALRNGKAIGPCMMSRQRILKMYTYIIFSRTDVSAPSWVFWLGFPGLICLVVVQVPVGLVFLLFMAGLSGLLECIHNLLFTFLSLRFIYSFNIFICCYICLTVYYIIVYMYIICYIVLSQLCFIFSCNKWMNQSINQIIWFYMQNNFIVVFKEMSANVRQRSVVTARVRSQN